MGAHHPPTIPPELGHGIAPAPPSNERPKPPTLRVSPLDDKAHLRRTVGQHHEALQVHQRVLEQHAQLHQVQAQARDALKRDVDAILQRGFVGRLRWLVRGK